MIDSWMPRKLEPGFDATYSKPSDLITSTMKSPPGRSVVKASPSGVGSTSRGGVGAAGPCGAAAGDGAAAAATDAGTRAAAPVTAALFRKFRRATEVFFGMAATV